MFHVEHMSKMVIFFLFLALVACDRPNSEPEKLDPIYSDLQKEVQEIKSAITATQKELEGFQFDLAAVEPQTGQIKYATKRVTETQARLDKLKQMQIFWELKVESRVRWVREAYMKAYKKKEPWPQPQEYQTYLAQKKLENAPRVWNLRERLDQAKLGISLKPSKETEKEEKSSE
jgi:Tfp pilus assembly protein PilP